MTPPDYKAVADELMEQVPFCSVHYHDAKMEDAIFGLIATALTQADALGYARGRGEAVRDADVLVRALNYCASILAARTPDSLGSKTVIKEWNKRAQHCWERATDAVKVYGIAVPQAEPAKEKP
jgi:hypothetical protein